MPLSRRFRDRNKTPLEPSAFNGQFVISIIVFSNHYSFDLSCFLPESYCTNLIPDHKTIEIGGTKM